MRTTWVRGLTVALFGGLAGCASSGPSVKTPMPEQYVLPPADDARFSQPVAYPRETLNQEPAKPTAPGKLPSQQAPIAPTGGGPGGRMATGAGGY